MLVLGRALSFKDAIFNFVSKNRELRKYEITDSDWLAIELVTGWLRSFRDATLQMSMTKHATLSSVHAVFKGLQDDIQESLATLPDSAPQRVKGGLIKAHRKLSDYFYKYDRSPFYLWASSKRFISHMVIMTHDDVGFHLFLKFSILALAISHSIGTALIILHFRPMLNEAETP